MLLLIFLAILLLLLFVMPIFQAASVVFSTSNGFNASILHDGSTRLPNIFIKHNNVQQWRKETPLIRVEVYSLGLRFTVKIRDRIRDRFREGLQGWRYWRDGKGTKGDRPLREGLQDWGHYSTILGLVQV